MSFLTDYLEARLDEMGWDSRSMSIRYSLNLAHDDGVCFVGHLPMTPLLALYKHSMDAGALTGAGRVKMLRHVRRQHSLFDLIQRFGSPDISLSRTDHDQNGPDAVRAKSGFDSFVTRVSSHCRKESKNLPSEIADCAKWAVEDWREWFGDWVIFADDQHKKTSLMLEKEAHALLQASPAPDDENPIRVFQTKRFRVECVKTQSSLLIGVESPFEVSAWRDTLTHLIEGRERHFDVEAFVYERDEAGFFDESDALGSHSSMVVVDDGTGDVWRQHGAGVTRQAIQAAKSMLEDREQQEDAA